MKKKLGLICLCAVIISAAVLLIFKFSNQGDATKEANIETVTAKPEEVQEKDYSSDFQKAQDYISNKEYIKALDILKAIPKEKLDTGSKINEAAKLYIQENTEVADKYVTEKKYKEALDMFALVISFYEKEKPTIESDKTITDLYNVAVNKKKLLKNAADLKKSSPAVTLMYHSISSQPGNDLCIPPEKFKEQMTYLKENNFNVINLDDLYWYFSTDVPVPPKTVVITLDDGYKDNYVSAYPILKELGLTATVYVITNTIDTNGAYVTSKEIKEMDANNIKIESHTENHDKDKKFDVIPYDRQLKYMKESKETLERLLNRSVNHVCYPFGDYNKDTIKAAQEAGYKTGTTIEKGKTQKSNGLYTLKRIYVGNKYNLETFKQLVK